MAEPDLYIRQLQGRLAALPRIVWGVVDDDATIDAAGSGDWSAVKNSTGDYTITFATAFSDPPAVVASAQDSASIAKLKAATLPTTTTARVVTVTDAGVSVDGSFHFIAAGTW